MAELLIRTVDKTSSNLIDNATCTKRGDVIVVVPDGWNWSQIERTNPEWIIIRSKLSVEEAKAYTEPPKKTDAEKIVARRAIKIDLDSVKIPAQVKDSIDDINRLEAIIDIGAFDIKTIEVTKVVDAGADIII